MAIDRIAALILVAPLLLRVAVDVYGINPVQFGLVTSLNLVLGLPPPPMRAGLYVVVAMSGARPTAVFVQLVLCWVSRRSCCCPCVSFPG